MDASDIKELFAPAMPVRCRRMFGGHGVYDGDLMFGLEIEGEVFLKSDAQSIDAFKAAGSRPFTYDKSGKATVVLSYWLLPEAARDDDDALRVWVRLALQAAERSALAKSAVKPRRAAPPSRLR